MQQSKTYPENGWVKGSSVKFRMYVKAESILHRKISEWVLKREKKNLNSQRNKKVTHIKTRFVFDQLRLGKGNVWSAHVKPSIRTDNCSMLLPTKLGSHQFPWLLLCLLILPLCSPFRVVMATSRHIDRCEWRIPYPITSKYKMDSMRCQYSTARLCPGLGHWE